MQKFIVEDDFWDIFPDAKIGVVICRGINNKANDAEFYANMLAQAEIKALTFLKNEEFSGNQVIQVWRDAFQKFKTKKGVRSSVEALLKRVQNYNHLGTINPLVDMYNSISLSYALPCGGEDMDKFAGDVRLTKAVGDEEFAILGSDENSPPYEGEIVYKDDRGAICRCLNWRESVRTMLTENTSNAFLCIELVDTSRYAEFLKALEELSELAGRRLGGTNEMYILDKNNKEIDLN